MKKLIVSALLTLFVSTLLAQQNTLYNPKADASSDIENALKIAKAEGKFVLLQAGGNWCKWCIQYHRFCKADAQLDTLIKRISSGTISTTAKKTKTFPFLKSTVIRKDLVYRCLSF